MAKRPNRTGVAATEPPPGPVDKVVRVVVSYAWDPNANSAKSDVRWTALRDRLKKVCLEADDKARKTDKSFAGAFVVSRLRATHGLEILPRLIEQVQQADIYVADVADKDDARYNANVMMEVGLALAAMRDTGTRAFLLKPTNIPKVKDGPEVRFPPPSNLAGVLWTEYHRVGDSLKLVDEAGFRAAFRTALLGRAIDRGLLTPRSGVLDDDAPGSKPCSPKKPSPRSPRKRLGSRRAG